MSYEERAQKMEARYVKIVESTWMKQQGLIVEVTNETPERAASN